MYSRICISTLLNHMKSSLVYGLYYVLSFVFSMVCFVYCMLFVLFFSFWQWHCKIFFSTWVVSFNGIFIDLSSPFCSVFCFLWCVTIVCLLAFSFFSYRGVCLFPTYEFQCISGIFCFSFNINEWNLLSKVYLPCASSVYQNRITLLEHMTLSLFFVGLVLLRLTFSLQYSVDSFSLCCFSIGV